jgi:hypothetical protein
MPAVFGVKLAALSEPPWVAVAGRQDIVGAPGDVTYNILKQFMFFLQTAGYYNEKKLDTT